MRVSGICRSGSAGLFVLFGACAGNAWASSGGITVLPDTSVVIQIVNFIFLIWALNVLVYKPIRGILLKRKEKIDGLEGDIAGLHEDAQQEEDNWNTGIREARVKGLDAKTALIAEAEAEEKQIIEKINKNAAEELTKIRSKIAADIDAVKASLEKDVDTFVDAIGQKILGRSIQ